MSDPQAPLKEFQPQHDFFVGIDSDGCVFDSMEIKHKECFIPNIIKHWNLQPVSKYARRAARANDALFYPVNPEGEEESWKRLRDESFDRFLEGSYSGEYEASLIAEFEALLPETPPWK